MAGVRAALLAAGRGVRMGGSRPKTLLDLDGKGSMLDHLMRGLKDAGVEDLLVVTGFQPDEMQAAVNERWGEEGVSYMRNSRYASWGNFHSVRVALDASPGSDLLVVNCDVVVHPDVFRRVMAKDGELVLAVQKKQFLDEEDMRVQLDGDRVIGIGKKLHMARSHGEYTGVSMLRGEAHRAYGDVCNRLEWKAETSLYYEDVYGMMLERIESRAAHVAEGEYAEVDTPEDVPAAVRVIERHLEPAS